MKKKTKFELIRQLYHCEVLMQQSAQNFQEVEDFIIMLTPEDIKMFLINPEYKKIFLTLSLSKKKRKK